MKTKSLTISGTLSKILFRLRFFVADSELLNGLCGTTRGIRMFRLSCSWLKSVTNFCSLSLTNLYCILCIFDVGGVTIREAFEF